MTFEKRPATQTPSQLNQYATEWDTSEKNLNGGNYVPLPGKCILFNYYVLDEVTSYYINVQFVLCMHSDAPIQALEPTAADE